jgi:hypothetical protein
MNNTQPQIIAIAGSIGSGKDTVAKYLADRYGYHRESFASSVKDTLSSVFGWPRGLLDGITNDSRDFREIVDPWWSERLNIPNFTPRYAMQHIATDLFRDHFNSEIWIYSLERRILDHIRRTKNTGFGYKVVITDLRFENEFAMVKRLGAHTVRVMRGDQPPWWVMNPQQVSDKYPDVHHSECGLSPVPNNEFNTVIRNDGTISEMYKEIDAMMTS